MMWKASKLCALPPGSTFLEDLLEDLRDVGCNVSYSINREVQRVQFYKLMQHTVQVPSPVIQIDLEIKLPEDVSDEVAERILFKLTDNNFMVDIQRYRGMYG